MPTSKPKVVIAVPTYNRYLSTPTLATILGAQMGPVDIGAVITSQCSLLAQGFNKLWHDAAGNPSFTHFCMIHSDVGVSQSDPRFKTWIADFISEMDKHAVSIVSAVIPLKTMEGNTSTALDYGTEEWPNRVRRLTLKEVAKLPGFFDFMDCTAASLSSTEGARGLLCNTGLWVAKLHTPWAKDVCFEIQDTVRTLKDGRHVLDTNSEDWNFFRWLAERVGNCGFRACGDLTVDHFGEMLYSRETVTGEDIDPGFRKTVEWIERPELDPQRCPKCHALGTAHASGNTADDRNRCPKCNFRWDPNDYYRQEIP